MNVTMLLAVAGPWLLAYHHQPSPTLLNQWLALVGWSAVLVVTASRRNAEIFRSAAGLWVTLGALALASGVSWQQGMPSSLWLCWLASLGALAAVLWASQVASEASVEQAIAAFFNAVLLGGVASALIAVVQVFLPLATDNLLVASSPLPGRAVGNLRQPNHLSDLLCWSLVAWVVIRERAGTPALRPALAWATGLLILLGLVLSGSRSAVLGLLLLTTWGILDRRLQPAQRRALWCAPAVFAVLWLLVLGWSQAAQQAFGGQARLHEADLSGSRLAIWRNVWSLILQQPWSGVGLGNFNLAWTLTPFPGRPVALFDHTHNLPLQWAVELGVPLACALLLAGGLTIWRALRKAWAHGGESGTPRRAGMVMVMLMLVFSLIEYPLWYAYFSLPACWLTGIALRASELEEPGSPPVGWRLRLSGALMLVLALAAVVDYAKVLRIYRFDTGLSSERRIEEGLRSRAFAHLAAYAHVTMTWTRPRPGREPVAPELFAATAHSLVDPRLLRRWAEYLHERGEEDRARYLAQRLREFRRVEDRPFFEACDASDVRAAAKPFQCLAPEGELSWRDFRR